MNLLTTLGAFIFIAVAATSGGNHGIAPSVHEGHTKAPTLWKEMPISVDLTTHIRLYIALSQQNLETSEEELMRVSDPSSPYFARYWTPIEVASKFAPTNQTWARVTEWLMVANITNDRITLSRGGWIYVNVTVGQAQNLLSAQYHIYTNRQGDKTQLACAEYSLPDNLQEHIDFIMPTVLLSLGEVSSKPQYTPETRSDRQRRKTSNIESRSNISFPLSHCSSYTTPDCLRAIYGIPLGNTSHPQNSFGIYQPSWVSWLPKDLDDFFGIFNPALISKQPIIAPVEGGYWQDTDQDWLWNAEPALDFEYAMTLTYPQAVINYQVGDRFQPGDLNELLAAFDPGYCGALNRTLDGAWPDAQPGGFNHSADCATLRPAHVIALSYAWNEANFPPAYLRRQCLEFLKLGLQGVSVIVSSADCGPAGQDGHCLDPTTDDPTTSGNFNPTTPATCPYVTVVGGARLPPNGTVRSREIAFRTELDSRIYTSGGGFSNVFDVPEYQRAATEHYLAQEQSALHNISNRFNSRGRGIPDVAAAAANFVVAIDGALTTVDGTSAAAPVFASVVVKLNEARLRLGKQPVGFLNPMLYANGHLLRDVVEGSNYGCGTEAFPAREGWDPVTGLGTPDYRKLLEFYLSLP